MDKFFPNRLREAIQRAGISQKALMEKIGVSQSAIYRWFNGAQPQKRIMEDLAAALQVNEKWLAEGSGEMWRLSSKTPERTPVSGSAPESADRVRESDPHRWISVDPARARSESPDFIAPKEGILMPVLIPVFGDAQAGLARDFEQVPDSWADWIPALIKDKRAFGVRLHGDSMEPKFSAGDVAIVTPSFPARNGDLVIACLDDEGFLFKVMSLVGGDPRIIRLSSYNAEMFPPMDYKREKFVWMYPVVQVLKTIRR